VIRGAFTGLLCQVVEGLFGALRRRRPISAAGKAAACTTLANSNQERVDEGQRQAGARDWNTLLASPGVMTRARARAAALSSSTSHQDVIENMSGGGNRIVCCNGLDSSPPTKHDRKGRRSIIMTEVGLGRGTELEATKRQRPLSARRSRRRSGGRCAEAKAVGDIGPCAAATAIMDGKSGSHFNPARPMDRPSTTFRSSVHVLRAETALSMPNASEAAAQCVDLRQASTSAGSGLNSAVVEQSLVQLCLVQNHDCAALCLVSPQAFDGGSGPKTWPALHVHCGGTSEQRPDDLHSGAEAVPPTQRL
jgi:hypothetical protein